jgi:hypothetical protein
MLSSFWSERRFSFMTWEKLFLPFLFERSS